MNKESLMIAARIKDLREFSDFTTEELSAKAGIAHGDYLDIENGVVDIPIGSLYNIAAALEIDPTVLLTGENSGKKDVAVVYDGAGMRIDRYAGYSFVSLAHEYEGREMEPMIVTLNEGIEPELVQHTGQEFNFVLSGKLRVIVGTNEYYLRAGDSIYFNPNIPHAQVSMDGESKFLTVILEK